MLSRPIQAAAEKIGGGGCVNFLKILSSGVWGWFVFCVLGCVGLCWVVLFSEFSVFFAGGCFFLRVVVYLRINFLGGVCGVVQIQISCC